MPVLNLVKHNLHCFGCLNGVLFNYWSKPYSICKICGLNPVYQMSRFFHFCSLSSILFEVVGVIDIILVIDNILISY